MNIEIVEDQVVQFLNAETLRIAQDAARLGGDPPLLARAFTTRDDGTLPHVSQIINDMYVSWREDTGDPIELAESDRNFRMALGFAWEQILSSVIGEVFEDPTSRFVHPGTLEKDGLLLTPDYFDAVDLAVYEYKATWKSLRRADDFEKNFWPWLKQIMAYCHALSVTKGRFRVFFVNGDYSKFKPTGGPQFRAWKLDFSARELEENWAGLLAHGRVMGIL